MTPDPDASGARGRVFLPDPLTSSGDPTLSWDGPDDALATQCVEVALQRLDPPADGVLHLRGRHVHTVTSRPPPAAPPTSPTGDFRYGVRDPAFLFVMAYYWLDELMAYVHGLEWAGLAGCFDAPVWVDPLGPEGSNNSHFNPTRPDRYSIVLGLGQVPDATDPAVLAHEYGHALHHQLFGGHTVTPWEEGFNDFLAACWLDRFNAGGHARTEVFPWNNNPTVRWDDWRRVDVTERFDDPDFADYDHYLRGSIWASTLWDSYLALGGDAPTTTEREAAADTLIALYLDTLTRLGPDRSAAELAAGLLAKDGPGTGGRHRSPLEAVFSARGLVPEFQLQS